MTTAATETAAFKTLGRAMRAKAYHARRPLLLKAATLYRSLDNARDIALATRLEALSEIRAFADFQAAASL